MDLIYTNAALVDVGPCEPLDGDFAWGVDENDFEVQLRGGIAPSVGSVIYEEGGEVGGVVRGYSATSATSDLAVVGDTWTGVLASRVIGPDAGSDYLTLSGDVRTIVASLVSRAGLSSLFSVAPALTGVTTTHTFTGSQDSTQSDTGRYMSCWACIWQVLLDTGCKVRMAWDPASRRVVLAVGARDSYTDEESVSAGVALASIQTVEPVNHLVCLGQGELAERTVVHLYMDPAGNVSTTKAQGGIREIADVYDDSGAKDAAALASDGTKRLREYFSASQEVSIEAAAGVSFDLGDVIGGTDTRSGLSAAAVVTKKVATFSGGAVTYKYSSTIRS